MTTLFNAHAISGMIGPPRNLGAVQQQMDHMLRHINNIPFPELQNTNLAAPANVTSTVAAVPGLRQRIRPTRNGQLAVAFAWIQAIRTAGSADLQLHFRVQDGSGTPTGKIETLVSTSNLLSGLLFTSHTMRSTREQTFQVYGGTGAVGTTWQVIVGSSVTVLTV